MLRWHRKERRNKFHLTPLFPCNLSDFPDDFAQVLILAVDHGDNVISSLGRTHDTQRQTNVDPLFFIEGTISVVPSGNFTCSS